MQKLGFIILLILVISLHTVLSAVILAQSTELPSPMPKFIKPVDISEDLQQVPGENGEFRLYFNSIPAKPSGSLISFPENKLDAIKQADVPKEVWVPAIPNKQDKLTTWTGKSPFQLVPKEVELWIRLKANSKELRTAKFSVTISQDGNEISVIPFSVSQKDIDLGGDQLIQVLVRQPMKGKSIAKNANLSVSISRDGADDERNVSIWGTGQSHVEFRNSESKPSKFQAVFGVVSRPNVAGKSDTKTSSILPDDFAFTGLTTVDRPIDIEKVLKGKVSFSIRGEGKELVLSSERDSVYGLQGKGLQVKQENDGDILKGTFRLHFIWSPEPFSCYRDRKLLGIWDPKLKRLRASLNDEAATVLPVEKAKAEEPVATPKISKQPMTEAVKPPESDPEKIASGKLRLAKSLLNANKRAAITRLEEIAKDFKGTAAAREAEAILKNP